MDSAASSSDESERDNPSEGQLDSREDLSTANLSPSGPDAPEGAGFGGGQSSTHKRRRVTRACDECRRKKIKCDGKQPCTHCTVYSYDCTYDQPSYRRKNPAPQYIAALEQKLARAEAVIRTYLPNLDWNDPSLDAILEQKGSLSDLSQSQLESGASGEPISKTASGDSKLELMVGATGQLELDDQGHWDYRGHSSGLSFIAGVREQLSDLNGKHETDDRINPRLRVQKPDIRVPSPHKLNHSIGSPYESNETSHDELPEKTRAKELCKRALEDATAILQVVHKPSFYKSLDRIYDQPLEQYTDEDQKFLPLLYAVIALGCLFDADEHSELEVKGYKTATGIGYKYFSIARQLLDITDCRDLVSLQAILFMILFLQCSAKLATCYSFIGVALRSALRMGLHRSFRDSFSPVEAECRKRAFWVVRKMDVYVGAMLGLPQTLAEDDIDQEYPMDIDDENITDEGIKPMADGQVSELTSSIANHRLTKIMSKIVRYVYPIKGFQIQEHQMPGCYSVSYTVIKELEMDLQRWHESLPADLIPGGTTVPRRRLRQQQLLRMGYAHCQMILYRPFLHYVSSKSKSKPVSQRCHACAAACVSVSHNITHITSEMSRGGLLEGSYWFVMYTAFFAVLSLVFFALENPELPASQDALRDAEDGKETMQKLAKRCMAADRCSTTLNSLFDQIRPVLERGVLSTKVRLKKEDSMQEDSSPQSYSDFVPEDKKTDFKTKSKGTTTNGQASTQRGGTGGRQRGMRLISHTGRPNQPKGQSHHQQQQSHPQPHPHPQPQPHRPKARHKSNSTSPTSQNHFQMYPGHIKPEIGNASRTPNYGMEVESPGTATHSGYFGVSQPPQGQDFYGQAQQYPFLPTRFHEVPYTANISNVSNMMFPSDNPFQYPNQPMTTLEQNYAFANSGVYTPSQVAHNSQQDIFLPASTSGADTVSVDDHIDVQLFGPIPSYMHSDNTQSHNNNNNGSTSGAQNMDMYNVNGSAGLEIGNVSAPLPPSGPEMWNQQVRSHGLPGMDLEDFLGNENWTGMQQ